MSRGTRRPPTALVVLAGLAVAFLFLPLVALLQRAPWSVLWADLTSPEARAALRLSLLSSVWATALALLVGVPLAWVLARTELPGRSLLRALALLPLVLPPVAGGVALLQAFGRQGLVGRYLDAWLGIRLSFTTAGVVLAETFVALPFVVLTVEGALRSMDRRVEDAAFTLGAGQWTVLRRVTLPLLAPGLAAGAVLGWARALGEFGATVTFAGNIEGRTQTVPLAMYAVIDTQPGTAIALSLLLVATSAVILVALRDRWFAPR